MSPFPPFLMGCSSDGKTSETGTLSDPVNDAKLALVQGDRRLIAYMGFGTVVPGTPAGFDYSTYAPGVKRISNVTDISRREEIERADDYATLYNQVILGGGKGEACN